MTVSRKCGCGTLHMTMVYNEERNPTQIFMNLGKSGGCASAQIQALQGSLNERLKKGEDITYIFDSRNDNCWLKIRCSEIQTEVDDDYKIDKDDQQGLSCPDVIAKMVRYLLRKIKEDK